ncbi:hypothetical protein HanRHA438_Chr10g0458571 [Helianthus annuus]|uniref:Uncharacterized protein n=1 Tax=Helianthus annuus TaxID=4232 RepID=A0A9K3N4Q7_HELAN|nr:hypothetical protein HanXRQr2_Chr10g0446141 [Helianthus annuus]KAJ0880041.1 hypothetical protein HanRHA438_Chr10g0458571 [Helianthus annuus]
MKMHLFTSLVPKCRLLYRRVEFIDKKTYNISKHMFLANPITVAGRSVLKSSVDLLIFIRILLFSETVAIKSSYKMS